MSVYAGKCEKKTRVKTAGKAENLKVVNHSLSVFYQKECLWSVPGHTEMTANNQPMFH